MTEEEAKTKWCPFVRSILVAETKDGNLVAGSFATASAA